MTPGLSDCGLGTPRTRRRPRCRPTRLLITLLAIAAMLPGCSGRYFSQAEAPTGALRLGTAELPFREYWSGIVFNGQKIGFTHLRIEDTADPDRYRLASEVALRFRFLTVDKQVKIVADERVHADLTLLDFEYDYFLDGNHMRIHGHAGDGVVRGRLENGEGGQAFEHPYTGALYPTSVIALYPVIHGLAVGREYRYQVYDSETQQITPVEQAVLAYETSDLFSGPAYKVRTRMHDNQVTTWINREGKPVFELSMGGALIAALERETQAKRYLAAAALNKDETLLDFSMVRSDRVLAAPAGLKRLRLALDGMGDFPVALNDAWQHCEAAPQGVVCEIRRGEAFAAQAPTRPEYLANSFTVPSSHPAIRAIAEEVAAHRPPAIQSQRLVDWIQANVRREAVDVFTALDVLETRKAECQGNTYLYAAFARALGIPTRVVNGLVYSRDFDAFLYHTWAESLIDGAWRPVDPTFGQYVADASHVKLIEGETMNALMPLLDHMGRTRARILADE